MNRGENAWRMIKVLGAFSLVCGAIGVTVAILVEAFGRPLWLFRIALFFMMLFGARMMWIASRKRNG